MTNQANAFDFWIGNWHIQQKILQQDETWLTLEAKTTVSPALDGRALVEHWEGRIQFFWEGMKAPESMKGLSIRAYNPQTGRWNIYWMDSRTPHFGPPYSGTFEDGRGEFFRELETPQGKRTDRITFSGITSNSVYWELAISNDEGQSWTPIWIMEMTRPSR